MECERVDIDRGHTRDAHQTHRNCEHARARADVQRLLEVLRRTKFLDRRERAISGRMMPSAKGLSGVDHEPKPPRTDVGIPWRNDQQVAAHPQRLETIHPCRGPSGILDKLAPRRPAGAREHPGRRHRMPNRREPRAAEPVEIRLEFQRRAAMRAPMVAADRASHRALGDQHAGGIVDHRGRNLESDLHVVSGGACSDSGHRPPLQA